MSLTAMRSSATPRAVARDAEEGAEVGVPVAPGVVGVAVSPGGAVAVAIAVGVGVLVRVALRVSVGVRVAVRDRVGAGLCSVAT